ncbi:MAG: hypothetical protein V3V16_02935 [Melioribacteraceae bacterium]
MKTLKIIILTILLISLFACNSKPEPNLQLFSPEAFAFDVGGSWEVNASINAKGFEQKEENNNHLLSLSYTADLITSENDTLRSITESIIEEQQEMEFADIPIEAQVELDSTFSLGSYKLIFYVTDKLSKQEKTAEVNFNLAAD